MISNRTIDEMIVVGEWKIYKPYALEQLHAYYDDLDMLEKGVKVKDLNFTQRKAALLPEVFSPSASGYTLNSEVSGKSSFKNKNEIPKKSFAILKLSGVMRSEDGWCSYGMDTFSDWLHQIYGNENIAGIMIKGRSGGGESMAGQILGNAIEDRNKPIVTYADMLGSAAVEGTIDSDEIIASGVQSSFGSIGVYASIPKWLKEYYEKNVEEIYSTKSPQKNLEWREYLKGNIEPLQKNLDKSADMFHQKVLKHRPDAAKYADTLEGGMFDAKEAKKRGLVDSIGTFNHALRRLGFLAGVKM